MLIERLCTPAVLYIGFSLIYIVIDIFSKEYVEAGVKFIVMIGMTTLLNFLCDNNLKIAAYFIVFLPLMFIFYLSGLIIYIFGIPSYSFDFNYLDSDSDSDSDSDIYKSSDTSDPNEESSINCDKRIKKKYKCNTPLTEFQCNQYAFFKDLNYKGTFAFGNRYPGKCFIKDNYKGENDLYYNTSVGKDCSKSHPCVCNEIDTSPECIGYSDGDLSSSSSSSSSSSTPPLPYYQYGSQKSYYLYGT